MRRPLLLVCLCLTAITALRLLMASPGDSPGNAIYDRETLTVTGRVYRKDNNFFYLDSVEIQQDTASSRQTIPLKDNLIGEWGDGENSGRSGLSEQAEGSGRFLLGSIVTVKGTFRSFQKATNPGEFDSAEYYRILNTGGKLTDVELIAYSEKYSVLKETLYRLRMYWKERLYHIFPPKEASVMTAMLLGDKNGLDRETKELYQRNGIIHILSISGLHVTIIGMGIYRMLRRIGAPPWLAAICGGGILILYGMMTGMAVSACRAVGMYLIRMLSEITGRTYDMLTAIGVMAVAMVFDNPLYLLHSGFLLSFGGVLGIGVIHPVLSPEAGGAGREKGGLKHVWNRLKQSVTSGLSAGLSITLATLPIQLWFYYEIPVYSLLLNLFVLPFMSLVMITGVTAMLVPGLGITGTADCLILAGYERLCIFFDTLPFHTWNPGRPGWQQVVLYYMILAAGIWIKNRENAGRSRNAGMRNTGMRNAVRKGTSILILTILVITISVRIPRGNTVTFLDVGQGDGICLQMSSGKVYLFDCGSSNRDRVGEYVLKPFLKYCGISRIDGVFVSHPDADHCNGVEELLLHGQEWGIAIERLILTKTKEEGFAELIEAAEDKNVEVAYVYAGDTWQEDGVTLRCLHPPEEYRTEDTNEGSECFCIDFGANTLLLTGDVEGEGEIRLLEEMKEQGIGDITVLKAAHHGSKNSTSAEFLAQAQPELTIISCGRNNRYGHPHEELLERLESAGSMILQTAGQGAVTLRFDRKGVKVSYACKVR